MSSALPMDPGDHHVDTRSSIFLDVAPDERRVLVGCVGPQGDPVTDVDAHLAPPLLVDRDLVGCPRIGGTTVDDAGPGRG